MVFSIWRLTFGYWPTQPWRQFDFHTVMLGGHCCWFSITIGRFSFDIVR